MSLEKLLSTTPARAVMSPTTETILSGASLESGLRQMVEANVGSLVVLKRRSDVPRVHDVKGIAPVFFALRRSLAPNAETALIDDVIVSDYIVAFENAVLADVLKNITSNKTWRMVVTDRELRLRGVLSATDILVFIRNAISGQAPIKIGTDSVYHHLNLQWKTDTLVMTRQGVFLAEFRDVASIQQEYARIEESQQDVLLLRLHDRHGNVHALFVDNDPVQTNVRLISSEVSRLADVYSWLLPSGYAHRQGDVGLYLRDKLPRNARKVSAKHYPQRFIGILSKRHSFAPIDSLRFYATRNTYYVRVVEPARLIHPEHEAQPLEPGLYRLIGAKGIPLPKFIGLRHAESAERLC